MSIVDLTESEESILLAGRCPDCGGQDGFFEGPRGGICVNIECVRCGARFNFSGIRHGNQRIREATQDVERLPVPEVKMEAPPKRSRWDDFDALDALMIVYLSVIGAVLIWVIGYIVWRVLT